MVACSSAAQEKPKTAPVAEKKPHRMTPISKPTYNTSAVKQEPGDDMLGGGCKEVQDNYEKHCFSTPADCDHKTADVSEKAYGDVLNKGTYLNTCNAPASMAVTICAAVINGKAEGVTVTTTPHDSEVGSCIAKSIIEMSFPVSPKLDITKTTFAGQ